MEQNIWYTVKLAIEEKKRIRVYVNDGIIIDYTHSTALPNIKFKIDAAENSHVLYDDLLITAW